MRKSKKKIFSPFAVISIIVFAIIGAIHFLTDMSYNFADFINGSISHVFRRTLASFGGIFGFSLFEILVLSSPLIIILVICRVVKVFKRGEGRARFIINLASIILLIYSGHLLALGVGHNTTPISQKMNLTEVDVTRDNLIETLTSLRDEVNSLAGQVNRDENGIFVHGYTYEELSEIICRSYDEYAALYGLPEGFDSSAKQVTLSNAMSYLGITGIYTYVTGEANVNGCYPDYVTLFTAAHEMAHQRGILRENEANFVAYILLATSDDPAMRYSAAINMYEYFASALYKTDKDAYREISSDLSPLAKRDIMAANEVYLKYSDTFIEDISDWINDFYLESSGSGGVISYSRVVELVLAYREDKK